VDAFEFAVANDLRIGVIDLQTSEQGDEGSTLGRSTGVFCTATVIETTLVADANGVGIVMPGVSADHLFGAAEMQLSVAGDIIVVATAFPAFGAVYVVEQLKRQMLVRPRCGAVNHNQIYSSHRQLCMRNVDTKAVITVRIKFAILLIVSRFIIDRIFFRQKNISTDFFIRVIRIIRVKEKREQ
jgi:hypothetical protein